MSTMRHLKALIVAAAVLPLALAGCTEPDPDEAKDSPTTLRVLAGSEVRDIQPVLDEAEKATGIDVKFTYAGTLDGAEQVASGQADSSQDATWFSSNRYLGLLPKGNQALGASTAIMGSPVVIGVRTDVAKRLGWDRKAPSWDEIGKAAQARKFTYGMTNPASSNSGFSALVGVATAYAGSGAAITAPQISKVAPQLTTFFSGQKLTSGSSGWLADRFVDTGSTPVDGLINYESVLLDLKARNAVPGGLTLVYPSDGVVSADYPLSVLASASAEKKASYRKLVDWLRTPDAQRMIMEKTHRRPTVPGVKPAPEFGSAVLVELPFPAQRAAADGLIRAYLDTMSRPSQTIYVVDTSGSMGDQGRLDQLKKAFATLSGKDTTQAEGFTRFRNRERVSLITFNSTTASPQQWEVPQSGGQAVLDRIDGDVQSLSAGGDTAVYDALELAYQVAGDEASKRPDSFTSIVLMTDGERTTGDSLEEFTTAYEDLPAATKGVPTFTVLFGDANTEEMTKVANLTYGKVFDARSSSLDAVFKEIRGYQ